MASFTSRLSSQGLDYVMYNKEFFNTKTMAVCGNFARGGLRTCSTRLGIVSKDGQINVFVFLGYRRSTIGCLVCCRCGGDPGQLVEIYI